jgi:outer membrane lipoprotein
MLPAPALLLVTTRHGLVVLGLALLVGCASHTGPRFETAGVRHIGPAEAVDGADAFNGETVIWGGRIAQVTPRDSGTELEILRYPLGEDQRPDLTATADRRFIARHPEQLDPQRYRRERRITVRGSLAGVNEGSVGDYPYTYPVLRVSDHELWPEPAPARRERERPRIRFDVGVGVRLF